MCNDPMKISNAFSNYFAIIGPKLAYKIKTTNNYTDYMQNQLPNSLVMEETTCAAIINIIQNIKSKPSTGFDNILTKLMKFCGNHCLTYGEFFYSMMRSGIFPDDLKIAKVIPLYKSGDSSLFTNYRPISLLPAFSKVFERLIYNRLHSFLEKYNILFTSQYAFRKQSSTEHATLELIDTVVNALNDKHYAFAAFIDLNKAFDTLDHNILLDKLWHYITMVLEGSQTNF